MNNNNPKQHTKLTIALLTVPTLLVISSFIILLVVNLILNPTFWMTPDTAPVTATPFYITALNGLFITIGGIGLLSLFPCLFVAIYLLVSKKQSSNTVNVS